MKASTVIVSIRKSCIFTFYHVSAGPNTSTWWKNFGPDLPLLFKLHEICSVDFRKIVKIVATRCQISKPKCIKFDFGWGSGGERLSARPGLEPRPFWPRPRCSHAFSPPTLACLLILMQETNVASQHAVVQINVSFVSLDVWSRQIIAWNSISRARLQLLWQT